MTLRTHVMLLALALLLVLPVSGHTETDWEVLQTLNLGSAPLDVEFSTSRNKIFVLTDQGELQIYATDGKLEDTLKVGREYDRIRHIQGSDVLFLSSRESKKIQIVEISFIEAIDISGAPIRGPETAPVTIAVFTDFECVYCKRLADLLEEVRQKYPTEVKVAFKNFPLRSHQSAEVAARAALAAGEQGKFWEFHDLLFANYNRLNEEKIREIAKELKLDMERFEKDRQDARIANRVRADASEGGKIGVRSTPTVFVNGKRVKQRTLEGFSQMIDKELAGTK
jgi:protein-disulfide isomerase